MEPVVAPLRQFDMSRIRSKDTKPEMLVRQYLHRAGFRFRLHVKALASSPDIYLPRHKVAVFVNGCFWHGHEGCPCFRIPESRRDHWVRKIGRTVARDWQAMRQLENDGITVLTVWECALKPNVRAATISRLLDDIRNQHLQPHGFIDELSIDL